MCVQSVAMACAKLDASAQAVASGCHVAALETTTFRSLKGGRPAIHAFADPANEDAVCALRGQLAFTVLNE